MLIGRLTDAKVRSLKKPGRYGDGGTLYAVVPPGGGSMSWVQRLTVDGKRRDIGLGGYPTVSLRKARERAFANRQLARDGGDPLALKRRPAVPTFKEAAARTYEANETRWLRCKTAANWAASMATYAYPVFGDRPVDRVGRQDVLGVLEPIWSLKHALAVKLRGRIRATLSWAQAHDYVEHNVAGECIDGALPPLPIVKGHHRYLPYREVGAALDAIEASGAGLSARACLRFVILTACRSGEARGATWDEIDLDKREWRIPAARMGKRRMRKRKGKNEVPEDYRVPLSDAAVDVLKSVMHLSCDPAVDVLEDGEPPPRPSGLVFPSPRNPGKPMTDMAPTNVLRRCGLWDRATVHGFRTTFRTWVQERSKALHAVAEAALDHQVGSSVERSYARSKLFKKRRKLLKEWARFATGGQAKAVRP